MPSSTPHPQLPLFPAEPDSSRETEALVRAAPPMFEGAGIGLPPIRGQGPSRQTAELIRQVFMLLSLAAIDVWVHHILRRELGDERSAFGFSVADHLCRTKLMQESGEYWLHLRGARWFGMPGHVDDAVRSSVAACFGTLQSDRTIARIAHHAEWTPAALKELSARPSLSQGSIVELLTADQQHLREAGQRLLGQVGYREGEEL